MKRIIITQQIKDYAEEYAKSLFVNRRSNFAKPKDNLEALKTKLKSSPTGTPYADYVQCIINKYDDILKLEPKQFETYREEHLDMITVDHCQNAIPGFEEVEGIKKTEFYKLIVDAMRYDAVRKREFLPYVKNLGIKTCVYCNAQYAVTTTPGNGGFATYELDHYYPKSKYPFLCTSFFNLQPSCARCNGAKSKNDALFSIYTYDKDDLYPFVFCLDRKSIARYMMSHDSDKLDIKLNTTNQNTKNLDLLKNHNKLFQIDNLYTEYRDVAEEVVWKAKIYNSAYRNQLSNSFTQLFPYDLKDFPRLLLGSYTRVEDIHKRPLTKLMQDIAREIGLLDSHIDR